MAITGMTANATIDVASAANALTVPVAALHTSTTSGGTPWGTASGPDAGGAIASGSAARLLIDRNGKAVTIPVRVTLTDGTLAAVTPVEAGALAAGDLVVTGSQSRQQHRPTASPMGASPVGGAMRGIH